MSASSSFISDPRNSLFEDSIAPPASVGMPATVDQWSVWAGISRRLRRERRRRKIGRAYDMAWEIARLIPRGSRVLDVGCGNGYIAHHLGSLLGSPVTGIDLSPAVEAAITYRQFDGINFPVPAKSHDAALLCYVLHHTQDIAALTGELHRSLRNNSLLVVYEDIPETFWDRAVCSVHNRKWRNQTGPCAFRLESEWRAAFRAAGFEIVHERQLSRFRNLAHPVRRRLFLLKKP